jgi:hypothetical protein
MGIIIIKIDYVENLTRKLLVSFIEKVPGLE